MFNREKPFKKSKGIAGIVVRGASLKLLHALEGSKKIPKDKWKRSKSKFDGTLTYDAVFGQSGRGRLTYRISGEAYFDMQTYQLEVYYDGHLKMKTHKSESPRVEAYFDTIFGRKDDFKEIVMED